MKGNGSVAQGGVSRADLIELKTLFEVEFKKLNDKIGDQNTRITRLEANVRYLGGDWCSPEEHVVDKEPALAPAPAPSLNAPDAPDVDEETAPALALNPTDLDDPAPSLAPNAPDVDEETAPALALNPTDLDDPAPSLAPDAPAPDAPALKNVYGRNKKKRTREEKEKEIVPDAHDDGEEEPAEAHDDEEPSFERVKVIPKRGKGKGNTILTRTPMMTRAKKKKSN